MISLSNRYVAKVFVNKLEDWIRSPNAIFLRYGFLIYNFSIYVKILSSISIENLVKIVLILLLKPATVNKF